MCTSIDIYVCIYEYIYIYRFLYLLYIVMILCLYILVTGTRYYTVPCAKRTLYLALYYNHTWLCTITA
jgi:hypothetical protein